MIDLLIYSFVGIIILMALPAGYFVAYSASEELKSIKKYLKFSKIICLGLSLFSIPFIFAFGKELILVQISFLFIFLFILGTEFYVNHRDYLK